MNGGAGRAGVDSIGSGWASVEGRLLGLVEASPRPGLELLKLLFLFTLFTLFTVLTVPTLLARLARIAVGSLLYASNEGRAIAILAGRLLLWVLLLLPSGVSCKAGGTEGILLAVADLSVAASNSTGGRIKVLYKYDLNVYTRCVAMANPTTRAEKVSSGVPGSEGTLDSTRPF